MEEKISGKPFDPVISDCSRILILGSFPSLESQRNGFYYGNTHNRFWRVLSRVYKDKLPETNPEKKDFIIAHGLALWDVIACCRIKGSADSSIKDAVPSDIQSLIKGKPVKKIILNGTKAYELFMKFNPELKDMAIRLPSTSPANAAYSEEKLFHIYSAALYDI